MGNRIEGARLILGVVVAAVNYPRPGVAMVKLTGDDTSADVELTVTGPGLQDFFNPEKAYKIEVYEDALAEQAPAGVNEDPAEDTALETAAVAAAVVGGEDPFPAAELEAGLRGAGETNESPAETESQG